MKDIIQMNNLSNKGKMQWLYNFNGFIASFKYKDKKAVYLFKELNQLVYEELIKIISNEYHLHYTEIFNAIKIFKVNINEVDCFFTNAIETLASEYFRKQLIEKNEQKQIG
jgi:hypothetical protein